METAHTLSMAILRQRKKEKISLKKKFSYSKEIHSIRIKMSFNLEVIKVMYTYTPNSKRDKIHEVNSNRNTGKLIIQ